MPQPITITLTRTTILNGGALFLSLGLVALSIASIYLTSRGMISIEKSYPGRYYTWYRGPSWDMKTKPQVLLRYDSANEGIIFAAGAISCIVGVVGVVGFFVSKKETKPSKKLTKALSLLPAALTLAMTLAALIYTSVIYYGNHKGQCYWENGYYKETVFTCTHELLACNIASYFVNEPWWVLQSACGALQTGRHLVIALFAVSIVLFLVGMARMWAVRKENDESAEERVQRLQQE